MATYAIGDVQGCFAYLEALLETIRFNPYQDHLWFTGDLVNRGPDSLKVIRFVKNLAGNSPRVVLGNHDLHLLAMAHNAHPGWPEDTLQEVLTAPDRDDLIHWLMQQPLVHHDPEFGFMMIHAGLAPCWDLDTAKKLAQEVSDVLQSPQRVDFFKNMYGNLPDLWTPDLTGFDRLRVITNYLTRARLCYPDGRLALKIKGTLDSAQGHLIPWFQVPHRKTQDLNILFGHWAALNGETHTPHAYALDTGCVWGHALTAMRLEDLQRFSITCQPFA